MTQLLTPPNDGSRNTVIIFGRLYQSAPGVPIAVPSFDAPTLEANGWTVFIGAALLTTTSAYAAGAVSGVVTSPNGSPGGLAVRLYIDGSATPVGTTVADGNGNWSVPTGSLAAGPHMFSVEIDESAGSFLVGSPTGNGGMDFSNSLNSGLLAAIAA
jgi:hypothetical protein